MMAALFDGITLTDAERKSVDSIRATYQPQMEELRSQGPSSRPQMRSLMQKETGDFRALLTSDQQSVFDKNVAAMQARMENRQGGGQGGGGMGGGSRTNPQQS
jgi:Spy/CpxP family protein refolding chaperone